MQVVKLCRVEEEGQVSRACQAEEDALEMQVGETSGLYGGTAGEVSLKVYLTVCCARCGPPTWCGRARVS